MLESSNRPLHNGREKGNEQRQFPDILLRRYLFPVNVDEIAHGLEGIK